MDKNLIKANKSRIDFDYQPGQQCYKHIHEPTKIDPRWDGPYTITKIHTNGTVEIQLDDDLIERVNIRRIKPKR
jgi:hypothetical protein